MIIDAGLGWISKSGYWSTGSGTRLIFPIRDENACVVRFIGRRNPALDDDPSNRAPKYLNSPDTALFSKRRQLYGLSEKREPVSPRCPTGTR